MIASPVPALIALLLFPFGQLLAQESAKDLADAAANPLADLISLPFQNNTNFGIGPFDRTANVLNIQPVVPLAGGKLITRTIFPVVWLPDVTAEEGNLSTGLGDVLLTGFYVPGGGKVTWGVGPVVSAPTGGEIRGSKMWGVGPSGVILTQIESWTIGALANSVWSVGGGSDRESTAAGLLQYFVTYTLPGGWYVNSAPIITVDWKASDDKWTIPFGGGGGRVIFLGKLPLNLQVGAYYNAVKPEFGPDWQLRVQAQILIPASLIGG
ncbi:MAG: neuromedin U [Rhodothermia bacterium]